MRIRMAARRLILCLVSPYYFPYAPQISGVIVRLRRNPSIKISQVFDKNLGETAALTIRVYCNQLCTPVLPENV